MIARRWQATRPDFFPGAVITSATFTAATSTVPEHCNVIGTTNANRLGAVTSGSAAPSVYTYAINWQVRLPTAWNGKFYMPGGGGTDGSIPSTTTNLNLGYAVAANDSGHSNSVNTDPLAGGSASFGTDYLARIDFAYNAIDKTANRLKRSSMPTTAANPGIHTSRAVPWAAVKP